MSPNNLARLVYILGAMVLAVLVFSYIGCGQKAPQIPQPTAIVVTTDADLRFALLRTHDVLSLTVDTVIAAKRFEEKLIATPDAPAAVKTLHGKFVAGADDVLRQIRKIAVDIDTKALTSWAAVQARIQPIVDQLNAVLAIATTPGLSWRDAIGAAVNIVGPLLVPGLPHIGFEPAPVDWTDLETAVTAELGR
jgi:hypothetical protein